MRLITCFICVLVRLLLLVCSHFTLPTDAMSSTWRRPGNNSRGPSPVPSPQLSPRHQQRDDAQFRPHVPLDPKHSNQLYTLDSLRAVAVGGKMPAVHQLADALKHQSALSSYGAKAQKEPKRRSGNF